MVSWSSQVAQLAVGDPQLYGIIRTVELDHVEVALPIPQLILQGVRAL
jgi:hypothetical protein